MTKRRRRKPLAANDEHLDKLPGPTDSSRRDLTTGRHTTTGLPEHFHAELELLEEAVGPTRALDSDDGGERERRRQPDLVDLVHVLVRFL